MLVMKRHIRFYSPVIYVLLLVCTALTMVTLFCDRRLFLISAAIFLVGILFVLARTRKINGDIHKFLSAMSESLAAADQSVLAAFPLPSGTTTCFAPLCWGGRTATATACGRSSR